MAMVNQAMRNWSRAFFGGRASVPPNGREPNLPPACQHSRVAQEYHTPP